MWTKSWEVYPLKFHHPDDLPAQPADGQPGPSDDADDDADDVHCAGDVLKAVADGQTTFF